MSNFVLCYFNFDLSYNIYWVIGIKFYAIQKNEEKNFFLIQIKNTM